MHREFEIVESTLYPQILNHVTPLISEQYLDFILAKFQVTI